MMVALKLKTFLQKPDGIDAQHHIAETHGQCCHAGFSNPTEAMGMAMILNEGPERFAGS